MMLKYSNAPSYLDLEINVTDALIKRCPQDNAERCPIGTALLEALVKSGRFKSNEVGEIEVGGAGFTVVIGEVQYMHQCRNEEEIKFFDHWVAEFDKNWTDVEPFKKEIRLRLDDMFAPDYEVYEENEE